MTTFSAVVVSHANERGLRSILGCLRYQTRQVDEILAFCSHTPGIDRLREEFLDTAFVEHPNLDDWGHAKRADGLARATGDWIGWFNDDDAYAPNYVEEMMAAATQNVDVVYCEWNENPGCDFHSYRSTAGNFIVRARLARQVGWTGRHYEADGEFIDGLVAAGARTVKLPVRLYTHNAA